MKFIIIPKEVYDSVSEEKRLELGIDSPRASVDGSKVILHVEHYDLLFKSLDMQVDDEPQYPYPVYDSSSSEFESVLSSK